MKRNIHSTDGFVVRRRPQGDISLPRPTLDRKKPTEGVPSQFLVDGAHHVHKEVQKAPLVVRRPASHLDAAAPASSAKHEPAAFEGLDLRLDDEKKPADSLKRPGTKQPKVKKWPIKRIIKWSAICLLVIALITAGYFIYKFISTGGQIFKGNLINAVFSPAKALAEDVNGRSNILLFGTSEDDPGHEAADLTDSMMLVSVDQDKKDAFLISIPRDLYVDYGRSCPAGFQGKINTLYSCVQKGEGEERAQEVLRNKIGSIFGLDVQYSAHVNYTALREAVDAVGGITVTIDSKDPRGILDRNFDWDCPKGGRTCYNVKYPNGPATLDGKHALYLARARGANGETYGLPQANFDREKYQRAILIALKDKAVSAGTLANPVAVNGLLTTLGNNVRTNFSAEEIKTLVSLAQDIKSESIASLVLNDPEALLVTTGSVSNQSIVRPTKGLYDYSQIQAAVKAYATGDKATLEKAAIDVFNASGTAGLAQAKANLLKDEDLIVGAVANAPLSLNTAPVQVFDLSGNTKPATRQKLEKLLGVTVQDEPSGGITGVSSTADFVVIIGTPPAEQ